MVNIAKANIGSHPTTALNPKLHDNEPHYYRECSGFCRYGFTKIYTHQSVLKHHGNPGKRENWIKLVSIRPGWCKQHISNILLSTCMLNHLNINTSSEAMTIFHQTGWVKTEQQKIGNDMIFRRSERHVQGVQNQAHPMLHLQLGGQNLHERQNKEACNDGVGGVMLLRKACIEGIRQRTIRDVIHLKRLMWK